MGSPPAISIDFTQAWGTEPRAVMGQGGLDTTNPSFPGLLGFSSLGQGLRQEHLPQRVLHMASLLPLPVPLTLEGPLSMRCDAQGLADGVRKPAQNFPHKKAALTGHCPAPLTSCPPAIQPHVHLQRDVGSHHPSRSFNGLIPLNLWVPPTPRTVRLPCRIT